VNSVLGLLLVVVIVVWLIGTYGHRVNEVINTGTVADSNGASVDREDQPIWYWYGLIGLLLGVFLLICVLIGTVIAYFT
jgi:hypothetical protein